MEGRPWLRILFILVGFALLGWPVWSITRPGQIAVPAEESPAGLAQPLHVEVSFAEPPTSFNLEDLGTPICSGTAPKRDFSCDWEVALPGEGVDLFVSASWPADATKTAVRVQVSQGELTLADQTFWTEGDLAETISVPGKRL